STSKFMAGQQNPISVTDKNGLTAVDDGNVSLCTQQIVPPPTAKYHLAISDPKLHRFADTGACVYVTDQSGTLKGDITVLGGHDGTIALTGFNSDYIANGFRVSNIAFDAAWQDTDPTDQLPGSFVNASNKIAAAINWIYADVHLDANGHPAGTNLAFCG